MSRPGASLPGRDSRESPGYIERNVLHGDHYVIEGADKVAPNAKVCADVEADRFLQLFVSRIKGKYGSLGNPMPQCPEIPDRRKFLEAMAVVGAMATAEGRSSEWVQEFIAALAQAHRQPGAG